MALPPNTPGQNFVVTKEELLDTVRSWHILPTYVPVRLGDASFEAPLEGAEWDGWEDEGIGLQLIEIYDVRHMRIQSMSEELLLRLGFRNHIQVTKRYFLEFDSEITILFFRRS